MKRCSLFDGWTGYHNFLFCVTVIFLCLAFPARAQQAVYTTPEGNEFLLYTPPGYTGAVDYPVLVSLHGGGGIGEVGQGIVAAVLSGSDARIPAWLIDRNTWPGAERPFIVVTPHLKRIPGLGINAHEWDHAKIDNVVDYVRNNWSVDDNRIYMQGISLGGAGTWDYVAAHPNKIAAIIVQSGKTRVEQACLFKNVPIWVSHGTIDPIVPTAFTTDMVAAINACTPAGAYKPRLYLQEGEGHEGWDELYDYSGGYRIYEWMLNFVKGDASNKPPYVSAGNDYRVVLRPEPIHLTGDYFDSDGTISSVLWTKVSGPSATMEGTNTNSLKLTGLSAGTYVFQLAVTDNNGVARNDQATLTVVNAPGGSEPVVNSIQLIHGVTKAVLGTLSEGMVINKAALGVTQFDFRAITAVAPTPLTRSVRFSLNEDQNSTTIVNPNNPFDMVAETTWTPTNGDYSVCVTPWTANGMGGTKGPSLCFNVTVVSDAVTIKNFYPKLNSDISQPASWGLNTDGSGTPPVSFTAAQQIFNVNKAANVNGTLTISGMGSSFWVRAAGVLTINQALNVPINTEGNAVINISTAQPITFGSTISNAATVNLNAAATIVPAIAYGHLALKGAGSAKTLPANTTTVAGTLTIDNDVIVNGAADNSSVLNVGGTVTLGENAEFNPTTKFALNLTSGGAQALNFQCTRAVFNQLTLATNTIATLTGPAATTTLELGSTNGGGGLLVNNGAQLLLNKNHLTIVNQGSINSGNQTGRIAFKKSSLVFNTQAANSSNLYVLAGSDSLRALNFYNTLAGQLTIRARTFITDSVKCSNGTLQANGFLALVSTPTATARIAEITGTGLIQGEVEYQRYIEPGRIWRYFTFPVLGLTVSEVQPFIPITGAFTGTSTGPGLSGNPSLYYYNDANAAKWIAYPTTNNLAALDLGRGYSIFIRDEAVGTKLVLKGNVRQGNFPFVLTHATPVNTSNGWNLLGNPYASPVQWGAGWTRTNINPTVYVRDNSVEGGRFLVWDGTDGDEEFGGRIAQGQSFWVKATAASPALTIHESDKINTNTALMRKQSGGASSTLVVEMLQGARVDRAYVKFNEAGNEQYDPERDAVKQKNGYFNLTVRTADGVQLAIDHVTNAFCDQSILLSIDSTAAGAYTLAFKGAFFEQPPGDIQLVDAFRDSTITIAKNSRYDFAITGDARSYGNDRFYLRVHNDPGTAVITPEGSQLRSSIAENIQWLLNGEPIEGATSGTHTPAISGLYQVRTSRNGCSALSLPVEFVITGITPERAALRISPNPASTYLRVQGSASGKLLSYGIVNAVGVESMRGEIDTALLHDGADVDITRLPPGMYILMVKNQRFRFIVE